MTTQPIVYRVADLCRMSGLSKGEVFSATKSGRLEASKLDRSVLIPVEAANKRVPLKFREGDDMEQVERIGIAEEVCPLCRGGRSGVCATCRNTGSLGGGGVFVADRLLRDNCRVARNRGRAEGIVVVVLLVAVALVVWWLVGLVG